MPIDFPVTEKCPAPSSSFLLHQELYKFIRSSSNFSRLNSPNSLSLSMYERGSSPLNIFVALHQTLSSMPMHLLYWGMQHKIWYSRCASLMLSREEGSSPLTCQWCSSWDAAQNTVGPSLLHKHIPSFCLTFCPAWPSSPFLQNFLLPACTNAWGYSFHRCRTWPFPLSNIARFLLAHFCSLSRSLWMTRHPFWLSNHSVQLCVVWKVAEGALCPIT